MLWVLKSSGCWEWQGVSDKDGYGRRKQFGKTWAAHRYVYTMCKGAIPEGLTLDHLCRNKKCVNPDHLEPVSAVENLQRKKGYKHKNPPIA